MTQTQSVHPFVSSEQAAALSGSTPEQINHIVGLYDHLCRSGLGRDPRQIDGRGVHGLLGHLFPEHLDRRDPLAEQVPPVLRAYFAYLEATGPLPNAFDLRRGFEATVDEFLETVRTGKNPHAHHHHHHAEPVQPFVRETPKVGRNDACHCGSGKKFKKCHGA